MEPMLDVSNLSFDYLSASSCLPVIDNISFQAFEGDFISIVGPSGCGKSTLLKSINRMNDLVEGCRIEGEIALDGQNIFKGMDVNLLRKRSEWYFRSRIRFR